MRTVSAFPAPNSHVRRAIAEMRSGRCSRACPRTDTHSSRVRRSSRRVSRSLLPTLSSPYMRRENGPGTGHTRMVGSSLNTQSRQNRPLLEHHLKTRCWRDSKSGVRCLGYHLALLEVLYIPHRVIAVNMRRKFFSASSSRMAVS